MENATARMTLHEDNGDADSLHGSLESNHHAAQELSSPIDGSPAVSDLDLDSSGLPGAETFRHHHHLEHLEHLHHLDHFHLNNTHAGHSFPDRKTLILLGLLFLLVGVLSYALHKCLYYYFPPRVCRCVGKEGSRSRRGWRGQHVSLPVPLADPPARGFLDDRRVYGRDGDLVDDGNDETSYHPTHAVRLASLPQDEEEEDDDDNENQRPRTRHKPRALDLLRARVTHVLLPLHHHPRDNPRAPPRTLAASFHGDEDEERDLEAGSHLPSTLYPPSSSFSILRGDGQTRLSAEGREEEREGGLFPPKFQYRNPFDFSPTLSPSPLLSACTVFSGVEGEEQGEESGSPLGLSRYFEHDGVGIKDW